MLVSRLDVPGVRLQAWRFGQIDRAKQVAVRWISGDLVIVGAEDIDLVLVLQLGQLSLQGGH